ncbi:MAG: DUF126 domain-containing protein [Candidatus Methanoplasma sp.]|jgi:predicted aconitase with swiveling domain/8-oxo-dGTP pyrophosphatase MutT (NUDIX family)|nr:DUF126 domain-containing protein [Candidatus Methanoplasma sp.]
MIIKGRAISPGKAEGLVVKVDEAFSFLGGVSGSTGDLNIGSKKNISGKVFVFPKGKGSTVGSFVVYDLMVHGKAPSAIVNREAETIVTTGAVISSVPMVDSVDTDVILDGDEVAVDGDAGTIDIKNVRHVKVVSSAIVVEGKTLLLRRPAVARTFPGAWSLVAGKIEAGEDAADAAKRELFEETQILVSEPDARLSPVYVRRDDTVWEVFPFLYRLDRADPILNHENTGFAWVDLHALEDMAQETVPLTYSVVAAMLATLK